MKKYQIKIMCLLALGLVLFSQTTYAQTDDDYGDDSYSDEENYNYDDSGTIDNADSSSTDSDYDSGDYGTSLDFGSGSDYDEIKQAPVFVRKAYVRFEPPYDSIREMVTYSGTVEVVDAEDYEIEVDTIYARAKIWMQDEFGSKKLKKMTKIDGLNEKASETEYKIVLRGTFPCVVEPNKFTQTQDGDIQFKMEVRFREGRYRYRINNLVHVSPLISGEKENEQTYFEYYMKAEDNVRGGDIILLAANKKISEMIDGLRKSCQSNPIEEDDDW
jgi:hypothetical protein